MIFTISLISITAAIAIPKLSNSLNKTNLLKIKTDILLIREALASYKTKQLLSTDSSTLEILEEDDSSLFSNILSTPIVSSNLHKSTHWSKQSNSSYIVWIDSDISLEFFYDNINYTFTCKESKPYCKDLSQ